MVGWRRVVLATLALAVLSTPGSAWASPPLRRTLPAFSVFALRSAALKNLSVVGGCNVGVDCAFPGGNASCGTASFEALTTPGDGSQVAADRLSMDAGADVFQLFRNGGSSLAGVTIRHPPVEALTPLPILPGTCGAGCTPDVAAVEAACGFPASFPSCGSTPLAIQAGADCPNGLDTSPGNNRCDLPPGTYGAVTIRDDARVNFTAGTYVVCSLAVGKDTLVTADGPAVVDVAGGSFNVGNGSIFGTRCGDFAVNVKGKGEVVIGKNLFLTANVCAPASEVHLGRSNRLAGQFVGDTIVADRNITIECCAGCVCIDGFMPQSAAVGDSITLKSHCDLEGTTAVRICGIASPILTRTASQITVKVPVGASGDCTVEVESAPGVFTATGKLHVGP
jgi:hypothetical protein